MNANGFKQIQKHGEIKFQYLNWNKFKQMQKHDEMKSDTWIQRNSNEFKRIQKHGEIQSRADPALIRPPASGCSK